MRKELTGSNKNIDTRQSLTLANILFSSGHGRVQWKLGNFLAVSMYVDYKYLFRIRMKIDPFYYSIQISIKLQTQYTVIQTLCCLYLMSKGRHQKK